MYIHNDIQLLVVWIHMTNDPHRSPRQKEGFQTNVES